MSRSQMTKHVQPSVGQTAMLEMPPVPEQSVLEAIESGQHTYTNNPQVHGQVLIILFIEFLVRPKKYKSFK